MEKHSLLVFFTLSLLTWGVAMASMEASSETLEKSSITICIRQIEVDGNTILDDEIDQLKQKFTGKHLTFEVLKEIRNEIIKLYLKQGYITSTAVLEDARDGFVKIRVIEGELEELIIENELDLRLRPSYIRKRIERGAGTPLNSANLESQLRLLCEDNLIEHIEASLKPSGKGGKSILSVHVQEAKPLYMSFVSDNYSPPSIGSGRFGINLGYRNALGFGDQIAGSYYRTITGGADLIDFSYSLPLNPRNGILQLRGVKYWTKTTDSHFEDLDIEGERDLYEIHYRQPLIRTYQKELTLSLGFTFKDGQTFIFENIGMPFGIGPDEDGVSRTSVIQFGQDFIRRGPKDVWAFRSQFNFGIDLFNPTTNSVPIPDGRFFSWLGQVQRAKRLGYDHLLIVQAELQLTPDGLLASEQFVIGGGQSVRGYRQNVRTGDNGFRFSIEDQIVLHRDKAGKPTVLILPFLDMGETWNVSDNPNEEQSQRFLLGAGLGVLWEPIRDLKLRLDYGFPFVDLDDRRSNVQDDGFYFSVTYQPDKLIEKIF